MSIYNQPADWQQYPLLLLQPGEKLSLTEQQRAGTSRPVSMALQKKLWLNFNGGQLTIRRELVHQLGQGLAHHRAVGGRLLPTTLRQFGQAVRLVVQSRATVKGVAVPAGACCC